MIILEENQNKAALDYTIGTLLLSKDLPAIKRLLKDSVGRKYSYITRTLATSRDLLCGA